VFSCYNGTAVNVTGTYRCRCAARMTQPVRVVDGGGIVLSRVLARNIFGESGVRMVADKKKPLEKKLTGKKNYNRSSHDK